MFFLQIATKKEQCQPKRMLAKLETHNSFLGATRMMGYASLRVRVALCEVFQQPACDFESPIPTIFLQPHMCQGLKSL